jgi:alpha-beta hydrolase superfamily lysophospholipase
VAEPVVSKPREETHWASVDGQKIALVLHLPEQTPAFCVVACHGLGASKDSEKYLLLGREFPKAGLALCRFDFRGCGESAGVYGESTVAGRIRDLQAVLELLAGQAGLDGRVGLLGSSMGGFVALRTVHDLGRPLPVVTWNCPATLRGLEGRRDADVVGLGPAFFAELMTRQYADVPPGIPWTLTIQADQDEVVPPEHGRILYAQAAQPRRLVVLEGADHRLTDMTHRMRAVAESLRWFEKYRSEKP